MAVNIRQLFQLQQAKVRRSQLPHYLQLDGGRYLIAAALILAMLGVPRAQIVEDYLLTNTAVDLAAQLMRPAGAGGVGLAATAAPILALTPAARAAVLEAHPSYLLAMFDAIESQWGSVDEYLRVGLGLDAPRIEATRDRLLVAATHDETTKQSTESLSASRGAA